MKPKLLLAVLFSVITAVTITQKASALAPLQEPKPSPIQTVVLDKIRQEQPKPTPPKPYVVVENDSLFKVAEKNGTTWERLWKKNPGISDPNLIKPGDKIEVPKPDEVLPERVAPVEAPQVALVAPVAVSAPVHAAVSGNLYDPGQCTWGVKNKRPDLPNNLGDAGDWIVNAQSDGLPTGSTPRAGAVGVRAGHVVYVTGVNGDGTINIWEMNYDWVPYHERNNTVPASDYQYIY